MKLTFGKALGRKMIGATSVAALALSLAACGPDDLAGSDEAPFSLLDGTGPLDWPVEGLGEALSSNGSYRGSDDWAPLAAAAPMVRSAPRSYAPAPAWDYPEEYYYDGPQYGSYDYDQPYHEDAGYFDEPYGHDDRYGYYDDPGYFGDAGYFDRSPSSDSFALIALAAILGGVMGDSPPDYYFDYGGVQPWVWETSDRYVRYAEPLSSGYRYYYYAPGAARPFLVRDPYYTYGYRGDRLAVIYDDYGRVLEPSRAYALRRAAAAYYDRGGTLYTASRDHDHYGVSAPLWQQRRQVIVADQVDWQRARTRHKAWRSWDDRYDRAASQRWHGERVARRYAAERFADWREADYRGSAPRVRHEVRTRPELRKAVLASRVKHSRHYTERTFEARQARSAAIRRAVSDNRSQPRLTRAAYRDRMENARSYRNAMLQRASLTQPGSRKVLPASFARQPDGSLKRYKAVARSDRRNRSAWQGTNGKHGDRIALAQSRAQATPQRPSGKSRMDEAWAKRAAKTQIARPEPSRSLAKVSTHSGAYARHLRQQEAGTKRSATPQRYTAARQAFASKRKQQDAGRKNALVQSQMANASRQAVQRAPFSGSKRSAGMSAAQSRKQQHNLAASQRAASQRAEQKRQQASQRAALARQQKSSQRALEQRQQQASQRAALARQQQAFQRAAAQRQQQASQRAEQQRQQVSQRAALARQQQRASQRAAQRQQQAALRASQRQQQASQRAALAQQQQSAQRQQQRSAQRQASASQQQTRQWSQNRQQFGKGNGKHIAQRDR